MDKNKQNLDELLKAFMDAPVAAEAQKDIRAGRRIFENNPAPQPKAEVIAALKSRVSTHLRTHKRHTFRRVIYRTAAVAAIIVVAAVAITFTEHDKSVSYNASAVVMWHMWDDDNLLADDLNLAGLTKKIEEIADNIAQAESDEYDYAPDVDFEDLETEMIAMNVDFWKG
jgi:hypothetical protein